MKHLGLIGGMTVLLLAACTVGTRQGTSLPFASSPELAAVDSLMWQQPDSALMRLLPYFNDTCRDVSRNVSETTNDDSSGDVSGNVSTTYNRHYANLLLAELLYKNDYAQTNRRELQRAVYYFDSLCCRDTARHASTTDPTIAFLDARAHYINGVGYYENDSMVEACKEYLKTLDVMEGRFEGKELVGKKAKFMAYTYNRLGDMFSEQFMMKSSIDCYENSLIFNKIEPTSTQGASIILYRIGNEYDKMGEINMARQYYEQAIKEMPSSDNLNYRDLATLMAINDYQLGSGIEQTIQALRDVLKQTDDESEKLTRFLTIGVVFFENGIYDSALCYLEPVFSYKEDMLSKIQTAEYLQIIYNNKGDNEKSDDCLRFLAQNKKTEGENKALVSQLEDLFENHMYQKQIKKTDEEKHRERKQAIKKTIKIIIPISLFFVALLVLWTRAKHKKSITAKEEHHQKEMEHERQTHRMQQSALSGRLKQKNKELHELKEQGKTKLDVVSSSTEQNPNTAQSYNSEPVCQQILSLCNDKNHPIKSTVPVSSYADIALSDAQKAQLKNAALRHHGPLFEKLRKLHPELKEKDFLYCYLSLLGLDNVQIAALLQNSPSTVWERENRLKKIFGSEDKISIVLFGLMNSL